MMNEFQKGGEDAAKAVLAAFGKKGAAVPLGSLSEEQLATALNAAVAKDECVLEALSDGLCYSAFFSDFFTPRRLSKLKKLLALNTFRNFVIGLGTSNPVQVAIATRKLMNDIIIPTMEATIGNGVYLFGGDPCSKLSRSLLSCL
jgi:hypothetical protein